MNGYQTEFFGLHQVGGCRRLHPLVGRDQSKKSCQIWLIYNPKTEGFWLNAKAKNRFALARVQFRSNAKIPISLTVNDLMQHK